MNKQNKRGTDGEKGVEMEVEKEQREKIKKYAFFDMQPYTTTYPLLCLYNSQSVTNYLLHVIELCDSSW